MLFTFLYYACWRVASSNLIAEFSTVLFFSFVCHGIAEKQNILICTNGSVLTPSKCAVQTEHLDLTAMVTSTQGNIAKNL